MKIELTTPISDHDIKKLSVGDTVLLSGVMITGRDAAHKWIADNFIHPTKEPSKEDQKIFAEIKPILDGGLIYHCGPVVAGLETKEYRFVAAGPTTSIREEPYQADVMRLFNLKGVIGKGGMAGKTLKACQEVPAVYFHAIGGAAAFIAERITEVIGVYKLDFGVPEALWVIRADKFPVVVTMDSHGISLHDTVREKSKKIFEQLIS